MDYCTECGEATPPNIKFCSNCGKGIGINKEATSNKGNKHFVKNVIEYFRWFKGTILHPSDTDNEFKDSFGLISIFIHSLLTSMAVYFLGQPFILSMSELYEDYVGNDELGIYVPKNGELYFKLVLIAAVCYMSILLIGFLCKKYLIKEDTSFLKYSKQLGSYSNTIVIIEIIIIIFILMGVPRNYYLISEKQIWKFIRHFVILYTIFINYWSIAYIASIITVKGKMMLDRIYVALISLFANGIIFYILFKIVTNSTSK